MDSNQQHQVLIGQYGRAARATKEEGSLWEEREVGIREEVSMRQSGSEKRKSGWQFNNLVVVCSAE